MRTDRCLPIYEKFGFSVSDLQNWLFFNDIWKLKHPYEKGIKNI